MSIYEYRCYRSYIKEWIKNRPKKGRGELLKISQYLNIHTTMVSHIMKGDKSLSNEHACVLAEYLGLSDLETDYFLLLVQYDRAGSHLLKGRIEKKIDALKKESAVIANRLPDAVKLQEKDQSIFYSSWFYSALRVLTTVPGYQNRASLIDAFDLSKKALADVLDFLLAKGLCVIENGDIVIGPTKTHLPQDSPFIWRFHQNWRIKAMDRYHQLNEHELMYTSPLTISRKDMGVFRERIVQLIQELGETVKETEPEQVACLNIDWFELPLSKKE